MFLSLTRCFTKYCELNLFSVCFRGNDFKPVQMFTSIMYQILQYSLQFLLQEYKVLSSAKISEFSMTKAKLFIIS